MKNTKPLDTSLLDGVRLGREQDRRRRIHRYKVVGVFSVPALILAATIFSLLNRAPKAFRASTSDQRYAYAYLTQQCQDGLDKYGQISADLKGVADEIDRHFKDKNWTQSQVNLDSAQSTLVANQKIA